MRQHTRLPSPPLLILMSVVERLEDMVAAESMEFPHALKRAMDDSSELERLRNRLLCAEMAAISSCANEGRERELSAHIVELTATVKQLDAKQKEEHHASVLATANLIELAQVMAKREHEHAREAQLLQEQQLANTEALLRQRDADHAATLRAELAIKDEEAAAVFQMAVKDKEQHIAAEREAALTILMAEKEEHAQEVASTREREHAVQLAR